MRVETRFTGFRNRAAAGRELAKALARYRGKANTVVVGLPRGGVITAATVAEELDLPLDVLVVGKLEAPESSELAIGVIGPGGVRIINEDLISLCGVDPLEVGLIEERERAELEKRERLYRGDQPPFACARKRVIVVDDGLATASTMAAAIAILRREDADWIVLAIPVAPLETLDSICLYVDELVCLATPEPFRAGGHWYTDLAQVDDEEVKQTLARARGRAGVEV